MINAIIVDDEAHCRKALRELVKASPYSITLIAECSSVMEAKIALVRQRPDILFLDIEMLGGTGFDLLGELKDIDFEVIFTTAHDRYTLHAIRSSALDYLLKPISDTDLDSALSRFNAKKDKEHTRDQVSVLLQNYESTSEAKRIVVPTDTGLEFIPVNTIIRLQATSNYVTFFLTGNKKLTVAKTLKEMEELLPERLFYRPHQSHIINLDLIQKFLKTSGGVLVMADGSNIPISRQRKDHLLATLRSRT